MEVKLDIPNIRGVLMGDLWAGKHITINDQFLMDFYIYKKCLGVVKAGESWKLNEKSEIWWS